MTSFFLKEAEKFQVYCNSQPQENRQEWCNYRSFYL